MAYQFTEEKHPDINALHARLELLFPSTGSGADSVFRVCRFSSSPALASFDNATHATHAFSRTVGMNVPAVTDWEEISAEEAHPDLREMFGRCCWRSVGSGPSLRSRVPLSAEDSHALADQFLSLFPSPSRFFRPCEVDYCKQEVKGMVYWGLGALIAVHESRIGTLWMQGWD